MTAEISEITDGNQADIGSQLDHLLTDLHEALRMLRDQGVLLARHDAMLEEYRPLIERFRSPLAAGLAARRERRRHV